MSQPSLAPQTRRSRKGNLVEREFGPASPHSRALFRTMRVVGYPFVAGWRPTSRGITFLRWFYGTVIQVKPMDGTAVDRRVQRGVPVEHTTTPRSADTPTNRRVILYLHGGGYVFGSPKTHRNLVSRLSHVTSTPVASVDYRMPPQTSLRGSQDDIFAAYESLLDEGYEPEAIVIAGDSAGGGHAVQLMLRIIERGLEVPAGLVLLSPWTDLTSPGESMKTNGKYDFVIIKDTLDRIARSIAPTDADRRDWHNSGSFAPDELLAQFPPTLIQVGARETLRDDGLTFARRLGAAGVTVESQNYAGQGHVVAMWAGTPDSRRAMKEIYRWLELVLPDHRDPKAPSRAVLAEADAAGAKRPLT